MGNCSLKVDQFEGTETSTINKNQFNFECVIGRGGFGKVWRVEMKKTK